MKKVFFTVGPSQLYPTVPKHIKQALQKHIPSLSHRSDQFKTIYKETVDNLRALLTIPPSHQIFFTASALEGMERTLQNTVKKHSFHFVNGSFSREFYQIAVDLHKDALRYDAENGEGFDFEKVTIPKKSELICIVQNETSTGGSVPMEDIYALKKRYPDKLIAVDFVSSIPYITIDFSKIDIAIFSVQKGFGLPAGLGVLIVNKKALQKAKELHEQGISTGSYHSFRKLSEFGEAYQTRETPNVLAIYLLGKVAGDMIQKGIDVIRKETDKKATLIYTFFETHDFKPYVTKPFRSATTIVIDVQGKSNEVVKKLAQQGIIVAKGYGKRKDNHIRIANFPSQTIQQVKQLLSSFK